MEALEKVPASHTEHTSEPGLENVPSSQREHCDEVTFAKYPLPHLEQWLAAADE